MSRTARRARPGLNRLGPIFPNEAHGLGKIFVVAGDVPAVDDAEEVIVAGKSQGLVHFLIEQEPVAGAVFHVVRAGGEIGADRLGLELADQRGKLVTAAKSDEAAAVGIDAAEGVGTFPGGVEGRNAAAAAAGDATIVAAGRTVSGRTPWPRKARAPRQGSGRCCRPCRRIRSNDCGAPWCSSPSRADRRAVTNTPIVTGISLAAISVSKSGFSRGVIAVGLDIDAGRLGSVVLRGNEHGEAPDGSRENGALGKLAALDHHALRGLCRLAAGGGTPLLHRRSARGERPRGGRRGDRRLVWFVNGSASLLSSLFAPFLLRGYEPAG